MCGGDVFRGGSRSGTVDPLWMRVCKETHRESHADTADLFEACVDRDTSRVKELQDGKDWMPVLASYYDAETGQVRGRRT